MHVGRGVVGDVGCDSVEDNTDAADACCWSSSGHLACFTPSPCHFTSHAVVWDGDRHRGTNGGVRNDGHFMVREQQLFDVLELLDVKKK